MELFRTVVKCIESPEKVGYDSPIVMLGSCFAENIGNKLQQHKFDIALNPFGIVYHPIAAAQNLGRMIAGKPYVENELQKYHELWFSFDHHGRFSHPDISVCIQQINDELLQGHRQLAKAKWLFITFGTAWGYRLKNNGRIVANCHKYPATDFERFKADVDEIYEIWLDIVQKIRIFNPDINIIFTVSPIRHLRDGAHENQLSKSTLLLAVDYLNKKAGTGYFPAYEIMLDELRDYRFYNEDMTHPNAQAIHYIWQCFCENYLTTGTRNVIKEVEGIVKASCHRPLHGTSECQTFASNYLSKIKQLQQQMPHLDFTQEMKLFEKLKEINN